MTRFEEVTKSPEELADYILSIMCDVYLLCERDCYYKECKDKCGYDCRNGLIKALNKEVEQKGEFNEDKTNEYLISKRLANWALEGIQLIKIKNTTCEKMIEYFNSSCKMSGALDALKDLFCNNKDNKENKDEAN